MKCREGGGATGMHKQGLREGWGMHAGLCGHLLLYVTWFRVGDQAYARACVCLCV